MQSLGSTFIRVAWLGLFLAGAAEAEIRIHDPAEVLATSTVRSLAGDLLFRDLSGAMVRLITSVDDPSISNRGDGSFHPVDEGEVRSALAEIPPGFLRDLEVDIYLLPYPRSGCLHSSADERAIYLSPGVYPYALGAEQHALLAHEIGHVVHRLLLPDGDGAGWGRFLALHGVVNDPRYAAGAPHAYRPHEVFAEDFRVLFGGALARGNGAVENPELASPETISGLREFFLDLGQLGDPAALAEANPAVGAWTAYPNPVRLGQELRLARAGEERPPRVTVIDVAGRAARRPPITPDGKGGWRVDLDASDLVAGAYWLRVEGASSSIVPVRIVR